MENFRLKKDKKWIKKRIYLDDFIFFFYALIILGDTNGKIN